MWAERPCSFVSRAIIQESTAVAAYMTPMRTTMSYPKEPESQARQAVT